MKTLSKINKVLFIVLLIVLIATYFSRSSYRSVNDIAPEVLNEPVQTEAQDKNVIKFENNDYNYELSPLYEYELNGLVVSTLDYTLFSLYKKDSVFPLDLCVLWGDNVKNKVHQNKSISFGQDMRWCFWKWRGQVDFNSNEISNNHLVLNDDYLQRQLMKLSPGDQIQLKGKLVNIKAKNLGKPGEFDPAEFNWNTSTNREDTGAGACETIYVEEFKMLKKGNVLSHSLFSFTIFALVIQVLVNIIYFLLDTFGRN